MQHVDINGDMAEYLLDTNRKIVSSHLKNVCKFKCGQKTCKYIGLSVIGFVCVKKTPIKKILDSMSDNNEISAKADNCEGLE